MKYQLVLQFPANSIADYTEMIALEVLLTKALGSAAEVDGHDCGSGEMNLFIHTDEPEKTFQLIRDVVANWDFFPNLVAAYRELAGEQYSVLWPIAFNKQFRIT